MTRIRPLAPRPSGHTGIEQDRSDLACLFETMSDIHLALAVKAAVIEYGGTLIPAQDGTGLYKSMPLEAELTLLGISHTGTTEAEAARKWTKAVMRALTARACDDQMAAERGCAA